MRGQKSVAVERSYSLDRVRKMALTRIIMLLLRHCETGYFDWQGGNDENRRAMERKQLKDEK